MDTLDALMALFLVLWAGLLLFAVIHLRKSQRRFTPALFLSWLQVCLITAFYGVLRYQSSQADSATVSVSYANGLAGMGRLHSLHRRPCSLQSKEVAAYGYRHRQATTGKINPSEAETPLGRFPLLQPPLRCFPTPDAGDRRLPDLALARCGITRDA